MGRTAFKTGARVRKWAQSGGPEGAGVQGIQLLRVERREPQRLERVSGARESQETSEAHQDTTGD